MAATNEHRLLSRLIRDRDLSPAVEAGVRDDWFVTTDERTLWRFLTKHVAAYGEVPTAVTVKDNFPTFRLLNVEDNTAYLLDQMRAHRRRMAARDLVGEAAEILESDRDHEKALKAIAAGLSRIDSDTPMVTNRGVNLSDDPDTWLDAYSTLEARGDTLLGLATGFPTIDMATAGLQDQQLITLIAPPKTGKSVLIMQVAINIHERYDVPVYFQSYEMSNTEQAWRHHAFRSHIPHARLVRGGLNPEDLRAFKAMLRAMEARASFRLGDSASGNTVSALRLQIEKFDPAVIFVDGVYLMVDEESGEKGTPRAMTNITRSLKRLGQSADIPVVISTQTLLWKQKGSEVTADAIGYSSSFFQDSDVILALQQSEANVENSRLLKIAASRNCGPAEADLLWDWEHGRFEEYTLS